MMYHARILLLCAVIATMAVIVGADETSSGDLAFFDTDVAPFRKHRSRNILDQLSIDKIIDQHGSTIAKDQSVGQRTPHAFSKDHSAFHPPGLPIYHRQSFKQIPLAAFKGDALFAKGQYSPGQRVVPRDNPLEGQGASFAEVFETRKTRTPLKQQQLFAAETPFRDFLHGRSAGLSFQKQAALVANYPSLSLDSFHDSYDKLVDSYGQQKDARTLPYEAPPMHAGYNRLFGLSPIWSAENLFPSNTGTPASASVGLDGSAFSMPAVFSNEFPHSSGTFKMKLDLVPTSKSAASMQLAGNCNTLVDSSPSVSGGAATTIPSISVSANQSSIVGHILTSLPTKPGSPVMATTTPIKPLVGNTLGPTIYFHATKYGTPSASAENGVNGAYSLAQAPTLRNRFRNVFRNSEYLNYSGAKNNAKTTDDTRSRILNYILGEGLKGNRVQNSLASYALPDRFGYDWFSQEFQQPDVSPNESASLVLPSAVVPAISPPLKGQNDLFEAMLTAKSDAAISDNLPRLDLASTSSISNNILGNVISTVATGDMFASAATLNPGQDLYCAELLQGTQETRSPWHPAGLQLQLGGFGGFG